MKGRALIVDDSSAMRSIIRRILQGMGFEVVEARHGLDALERLQACGPLDVALVDWNMPEMNGLDFVCAVREQERYQGMRLVMVTTESDVERIQTALDNGANEYVMKPFTPDCIREKLALLGMGGESM